MTSQEHLDLLMQGSKVWNAWRELHGEMTQPILYKAHLDGADLTGADLSYGLLEKADLTGADLTGADLGGSNLSEAILCGATLINADLSYTIFSKADLTGANLSNATLTGATLIDATLTGADLTGANFSRATLSNANLGGAITWETIFSDVDLSTVGGLTTVRHAGPSSIGIDTIYRSQGKIPERFLRDAGVPGAFLDYIHSLVQQAIQYFTCFISHSHKDQHFCDRLYTDLRYHDVPSWYFPEDAAWGKSVWGEIDRSIKFYDKLVVVCSEHSLQSPAVLREIERALQREDREGKHILFPIRIDNYLFEKWEHERKADVVSKVAGDFRGWRNADKYDRAFQKFLKALKAQE